MISTEAGIRASREALLHLRHALADLEKEKERYHPATYALMSEPIQHEILAIEGEIAEYERLSAQRLPDVVENGSTPRPGTESIGHLPTITGSEPKS
jgi:hypothetical protein